MTRRTAWALTLAFLAAWAVLSAEPAGGTMPNTGTTPLDYAYTYNKD